MTKFFASIYAILTRKSNGFILISSLFFLCIQNIAFWKKLFEVHTFASFHDVLFLISIACFLLCGLTLIFSLFCWKYTSKIVLSFFLLASAATNYYSLNYGVYMDKNMIANVLQTTRFEAADLITWRYTLWMVVFGILPCLWLWRTPISFASVWWKNLLSRLALMLCAIGLLLATGLPFYKEYAPLVRNHRELVKLITPSNYIIGLISYTKQQIAKNRPLEHIALDAKIEKSNKKKTIFIMVMGETSRAQNFALNGYPRPTNPHLQQYPDLINFTQVFSCGTATAESVPCLFSKMGRDEFSASVAAHQENVLDIIQRVGVSTYWLDNDSGCKGVCNRVSHQDLDTVLDVQTIAQQPAEGLFYDDLLLKNLDKQIQGQQQGPQEQSQENPQGLQNHMIVLHTNGSHGPAYYQRYRHDLKGLFQPTCDTNAIENCSQQQLINTYDNSIIGIDDMLDKTIQWLKRYENQYNIALLYLSDHGESLGEDGLYLHGTPYMIAPTEQTHVPMIFWANSGFYQDNHVRLACLQKQARTQAFSHDNIFHSLLGFWNIQTKDYQPSMDIFHACKTNDTAL